MSCQITISDLVCDLNANYFTYSYNYKLSGKSGSTSWHENPAVADLVTIGGSGGGTNIVTISSECINRTEPCGTNGTISGQIFSNINGVAGNYAATVSVLSGDCGENSSTIYAGCSLKYNV
jgi:hypothetical protein